MAVRVADVQIRRSVGRADLTRLAVHVLSPDWEAHERDRTIVIRPPVGVDPGAFVDAMSAQVADLVSELNADGWVAVAIPPYFPSIPFWQVNVKPPG